MRWTSGWQKQLSLVTKATKTLLRQCPTLYPEEFREDTCVYMGTMNRDKRINISTNNPLTAKVQQREMHPRKSRFTGPGSTSPNAFIPTWNQIISVLPSFRQAVATNVPFLLLHRVLLYPVLCCKLMLQAQKLCCFFHFLLPCRAHTHICASVFVSTHTDRTPSTALYPWSL